MFDVFYYNRKPGLFAFEQPADSLEAAAAKCRTGFFWYIDGNNDYAGFNFDWQPPAWEQDHIHVWPNQWHKNGGVHLAHRDHAHKKNWHFRDQRRVKRSCNRDNWIVPSNIDESSIDFTWHPDPLDPPYIHVFLDQWGHGSGVQYVVPGATDEKVCQQITVKKLPNMTNWVVPDNIDQAQFDFSWTPSPYDPPYIHVFPTQWYNEGGPEYHVPGATDHKFVRDQVAVVKADETLWTIPEEVNRDSIDFSWVPHPKEPPYIYHFGTEFQESVGLIYTMPGATEIKFGGTIPTKTDGSVTLSVVDMFFVDKSNAMSQSRFDKLKERYPNIQRIRYANSIMDTIKRCVNRAKTTRFWVVSSEYNYDDFDFMWHPAPWQNQMTHIFPSEYNKWSDTFLINRWEFERHSKWAHGIEQFPNLNFVEDQIVKRPENTSEIFYFDHGNDDHGQYAKSVERHHNIIKLPAQSTYLDAIKLAVSQATTEYLWITNSVCEYSQFDFRWEPEPWQREMVHCFYTGAQQRGDTFFVNVKAFKENAIGFEMMEFFKLINYVEEGVVTRFPMPMVKYDGDDLARAILDYDYKNNIYAEFAPANLSEFILHDEPCLWTPEDYTIESFVRSNRCCIVPRVAQSYIKNQVYDYPYINSLSKKFYYAEDDLDIIYISNGEPDEEKWFEHAEYMSNRTVKWIRGVNGRAAAYQAAAKASNTAWFFTIFAKLEVLGSSFNWYWKPDYFQEPKHYIFNARNPVNGLEYGHQGMIAYNKRLVLENTNPGIDFTLSQPHESVDMLSGIAHFNQTPWMTWRTAFREVLKLQDSLIKTPTPETEHRLNTWLTVANGNHAEWCLRGAADAVAYYNEVGGDYNKLLLSFEWTWLQERFNSSYNNL